MNEPSTPHVTATSYYFEYPEEIQKRIRYTGLDVPIRDIFEMMARDIADSNPQRAAFFRLIAAYYPHHDNNGYIVERDSYGAILIDFDDWDELTDEQKMLRGNRNAAIAVLDRLRSHLEMMDDDLGNKDEVDAVRRALNELIEPLSFT
jgi:hypothetical protein